MTRLISLILVITMLCLSILFTASCNNGETPSDPPNSEGGEGSGESGGNGDAEGDTETAITVPEYKDYGRGTVDFSDMSYERPDMAAAEKAFSDMAKRIEEGDTEYDTLLSEIFELEAPYTDVLTMYAMANIQTSKDTENKFWADEYEYISKNYSAFAKAIEELFVAAANSQHAESFERDYFGDGLIEEYRDGGIYTDDAVALMATEAEYEADFLGLSPATVTVTYDGITDTVENILSYYLDKYGRGSKDYLFAKIQLDTLYQEKYNEITGALLVDLIKTRRLIANELGMTSYAQFAYRGYHDYDAALMDEFLLDIPKYVLPVYLSISGEYLTPFISEYEKTSKGKLTSAEIINGLYGIYGDMDDDLAEAYSYMLQHKLFDVAAPSDTRFDGSFTTYLDGYSAPYLFVTMTKLPTDYMTMAHEFGHFADSFVNYNSEATLDLSEVSSQALELLTMLRMDELLSGDDYTYVKYHAMEDILLAILYQGFYARFEKLAYSLDYSRITLENLNGAVSLAAAEFGLSSRVSSVQYVMIPHIVMYPFYVQSYCTSAAAAAEIFFLETESAGAGLAAYKTLIDRNGETGDFISHLESVGIGSPFRKDALKTIADSIHYYISGSHYFRSGDITTAA